MSKEITLKDAPEWWNYVGLVSLSVPHPLTTEEKGGGEVGP